MRVGVKVLKVLALLRERYGAQELAAGQTEVGVKETWNYRLEGFPEADLRDAALSWMAEQPVWPVVDELVRLTMRIQRWRRGRGAGWEPGHMVAARSGFREWWGPMLAQYPWQGGGVFVSRGEAEQALATAVASYGIEGKRYEQQCLEAWMAGGLPENFAAAMRRMIAAKLARRAA